MLNIEAILQIVDLEKKGKQEIFMKTVLNDEEGISKISTCKKIEKFKKES